MIEQIGASDYLNEYCRDFIELIKKEKKLKGSITAAEIGIGIGTTAVEALKNLDSEDTYYIFDFQDRVKELIKDVSCSNVKLVGIGNSGKLYDSYSWNLAKLLLQSRTEYTNGLFDVVYLDGAHSYMHDAMTCCLLKELVKVDGYIVFDDVYWSFANSPTMSKPPTIDTLKEQYTEEQINECHIDIILELFMRNDDSFQQIYFSENRKPRKATFHRVK